MKTKTTREANGNYYITWKRLSDDAKNLPAMLVTALDLENFEFLYHLHLI